MKTQRDLNIEYWGRVHDMCTAYNKKHGTDVKPWDCVKYDGRPCLNPVFVGQLDLYDLAVTILEGKPVFVGDKIFLKADGKEYTVYGPVDISSFTWTPPSPKLTPIYDDFKLPGNIISNPNFNKLHLVDWDKVENFSDVKLILQAVQFSFGPEHKHFDKIKHLLSEEI